MDKKSQNKCLYFYPTDYGLGDEYRSAGHRSRRLTRQYGHFVRDMMLYIFWYLRKAKLLNDSDLKLYLISPFNRGYLNHYIELAKLIVPNLEVVSSENIPECRRIKEVVKFIKECCCENQWSGEMEFGKRFFQKNHTFQKYAIDLFRDHCFKSLNFTPELKKRLLFVPRHDQVRSHYLAHRSKPQRWLEDEKLIDILKTFCQENGYEFCHWENHAGVPLTTQIEMYSESEIIIGVTGTDFTNTYWCDDKQLIIEMLPTNYYSGFAPAFYSPDIEEMIELQKTCKIPGECPPDYKLNKKQKRNWHIIYCDDLDEWFRHTRIKTTTQNQEKISRLIYDHASS